MGPPKDNQEDIILSLSRRQSTDLLDKDSDNTISLQGILTEEHSINKDQEPSHNNDLFIYALQNTYSDTNQHHDPYVLAHSSQMNRSDVEKKVIENTTVTSAATHAVTTEAATTPVATLKQQFSSTNHHQEQSGVTHSSHTNRSDTELSLVENSHTHFHYDSCVDSYHTASLRTHNGHSTLQDVETIQRSGTRIDRPSDESKTESGTSIKSLSRSQSLTEWLNNDIHPAQIGISSDFVPYARSDERLNSEASQISQHDSFQTAVNILHTAISVPFCPICFDSASFPIKTSCGHTFCGPCLLLVWEYQRSAFEPVKCPYCRKLVTQIKLNFSAEEERLQSEEKDELLGGVDLYNRRFTGGPRSWLQYLEDTPTVLVTLYYSDVGDILFRWLILRVASSAAVMLINYDWGTLYESLS